MSEGTPKPEGKKLKRPVEEVRKELLADPDVKEQARLLQLPVEQYVEKILDYAIHPEKPPQIQIVPDEALKAQDPSIPTVEEIQTHLEKIVSGEISISPAHMPDGYSKDRTHQKYPSALGTAASAKEPAVEPPVEAVPDLDSQ
jgi:hypothetical protein